jgi:hypothetical protein
MKKIVLAIVAILSLLTGYVMFENILKIPTVEEVRTVSTATTTSKHNIVTDKIIIPEEFDTGNLKEIDIIYGYGVYTYRYTLEERENRKLMWKELLALVKGKIFCEAESDCVTVTYHGGCGDYDRKFKKEYEYAIPFYDKLVDGYNKEFPVIIEC